ncbi:MAG: hypothetical protein LBJ08_01605 [Bifidobacteriaceae bacterium]|jgi:S-DNA-T family DNA segregation ATPase FtsK/SpoIIIE|nr:hypothetical protein [Bifidobacteriaceae bacterium]
MRFGVSLHDSVTGTVATAFVDVDPASTIADLLPVAVNAAGADATGADRGMAVDGAVADSRTTVADAGLHEGSWITLLGERAAAPPRGTRPAGDVELRVVSGTGAGTTYHCGQGTIGIGAGPAAAVQIADPAVTGVVARLVVRPDATAVVRPENGVELTITVDGAALTGERVIGPGDQIVFPTCIVELASPASQTAALELDEATGALKYSRPPRILPPEPSPHFRLPTPPEEPTKQPIPMITALAPLFMGILMAMLYSNARMLIFGVMSPIIMVSNYVTARRLTGRKFARQEKEYREHKTKITEDATAAAAKERSRRRYVAPDPAELAEIAVRPTPRLWARRTVDPQWLHLRFGTATQPSEVTLEDPEELEHKRLRKWELRDVPAVVSLAEAGALGIAGADGTAQRLGLWALEQLAVLHSPKDLAVYVLGSGHDDAGRMRQWESATWVPHTRPTMGQDAMRTVAFSAQQAGTRISELLAILDARQKASGTSSNERVWVGSSVVVILDGSYRLRTMPGIATILTEGPAVGIYSICLDSEERFLPEECQTVVLVEGARLRIRQQRAVTLGGILPDWVSDDWIDWVARALAPIEDASPTLADSAIPTKARLLDIIPGLDPPSPTAIEAIWALGGRSTTAQIGEGMDGPFALDLVHDGPHGLVAGTTGSGKSELLQTIVGALATVNTPEAMTFVLVDYKGGAAFKDCENLPHTVGTVTDLDTHLVERALTSLGAELKYREHILGSAGAKDLDDYVELAERRSDLPRVPRLLIVIDEFASLVRELPDFVPGLVNIAQRGRSLGIHLILATQRPSGVVSPEIRANTNLRIALRVTDAAESTDIIDAPEAGAIPKSAPGRAYARLGATSLVPFQSGRVGGRAPDRDAAPEEERLEPLVRPMTALTLADPPPKRSKAKSVGGDVEVTDLKELVQAIGEASARMGFAKPRAAYLGPLPEAVTLDYLIEQGAGEAGAVPFGLEDLPASQAQRPISLDLDDFGNMYLVGAARSGRTTALRTIAVAAARTWGPDQVHLYALDFGAGGLAPLGSLPHCGVVVPRTGTERAARLVGKLLAVLTQRQAQLAASGYSSIGEYRRLAGDPAAPAQILLLIDSWDGFLSAFEEVPSTKAVDGAVKLLREGVAAGIHVIVGGDEKLLSGRYFSYADDKFVLRLVDRDNFSLIGLRGRDMPEKMPPGRCFRADGGIETQVALPASGTFQDQADAIRLLGNQLTKAHAAIPRNRLAFSVADMPDAISRAQAAQRYGPFDAPGRVFVGIGGEDAEPIHATFSPENPRFVVAGPPRSGKTNALVSMALSGLASGFNVAIIAPRPGDLRKLAGQPGVVACFEDPNKVDADALEPILNPPDPEKPLLIVIDDAEQAVEMPGDEALAQAIGSEDRAVALMVAGESSALRGMARPSQRHIVADAVRRGGQGLLSKMSDAADGELIGHGRFTLAETKIATGPGRGYIHTVATGTTVQIQVPKVSLQEDLA